VLTADLVAVTVRQGEVRPRWVDPADPERLALAARLIEVFGAAAGRPRAELEAELAELTGTGTAFRFHRALAKLLAARCEFATAAAAEPEAVREAVFAAAAAMWRRETALEHPPQADEPVPTAEGAAGASPEPPGGGGGGPPGEARARAPDAPPRAPFHHDRDAVLATAARGLGIGPGAADAALYADLQGEQVLAGWEPCAPAWLLNRYNVALAQGVLLRATALTIEIAGQDPRRYRALFRKVKFFQLLHRVEGDAERGYTLHLDGPLSLFGASQRYGLQMASFLPTLLHFDRWRLTAEVIWGRGRQRRRFRLGPEAPLAPIGRLTGQWQPDEVAWLPERIAALDSAWEVAADGELIDLGGEGVLVPDLAFRHRATGERAWLEVLGYWNRGAVTRRLELLRRHGPKNLILALSKSLAAGEEEALDGLPAEVYVYRSAPSARRIVAALGRLAGGGGQSGI